MPVVRSSAAIAIATGPTPAKVLGVKASTAEGTTAFDHPEIAAFVQMLRTSAEQKRPSLRCDPKLMIAAKQRAADLANRRYFSHTDPDGRGPNYYARQAGYALPEGYGVDAAANNIESITAGATAGVRSWQSFMDSPKHKAHLTGSDSFFMEQTDFGIARVEVPGSPYTFYWCFLSSRPA